MPPRAIFSIEYVAENFVDKNPKYGMSTIYKPFIDLLLIGENRKISRPIRCLVDSGADFNIFPAEIAQVQLGMTDKQIQKGRPLDIFGIGTIMQKAFGHEVTFKHSDFTIKNLVYFMYGHKIPLLGRKGFMSSFKKMEFDEENKKLILHLK